MISIKQKDKTLKKKTLNNKAVQGAKGIKHIFSAVLTGVFVLCLTSTTLAQAFTMAPKPEPLQKDEEALIGIYKGPGAGFAIGENLGRLTLIYPNLRKPDPKDKEAKNSVFVLDKVHYDEYSFPDDTPNFTAEDTMDFTRNREGLGVSIRLGDNNYTRRFTAGEDGKPFRIKPDKPMSELRKLVAGEIVPKHKFTKTAELVDLEKIVPGIHLDLRYAGSNNLFGEPLVLSKKAYLDKEAALALKAVNATLKPYGYSLLVWEAYRSWSDFKVASLALGPKNRYMLPKPENGFSHNTGRSIAVSIYDESTKMPVSMICDFDELTPAQYQDFLGGTELARWERDLLANAMESAGFTGSKNEWWHFDYNAKEKYELLNVSLN